MGNRRLICAVFLFWCGVSGTVSGIAPGIAPGRIGQDLSRPVVDFEKQVLVVWGLGGTPWEESSSYEEEKARAWMNALHQGYEAILGIPLMEGLSVRNALQMNSALKERLGMVLLSAPKKFFEPDLTGLLRCKLEIPFNGAVSLRSALYLAALRPQPMEPLPLLASWASLPSAAASGATSTTPSAATSKTVLAGTSTTASATGSATASEAASPATSTTASGAISTAASTKGSTAAASRAPTAFPDEFYGVGVKRVILDLRRTNFEPSLFPRFFTEEGYLLYQEARTPSPDRFSRPAIRFTQDIAQATNGLSESDIRYVSARLPLLAQHDVKISASEQSAFLAFCRHLDAEPQGQREIVIVYDSRAFLGGILPKATAPAGGKPAKIQAPPKRRKR
ncbi:hypothetical protein AUK22_10840 [bacterium CG2_30_54_10]|nr:MAG: hypothetical protein AUK22_10840 [bacterium CG2_30_54_10]